MSKSIVDWDIDEATYVGDEEDGAYYLAGEGPDGWYVTVLVDCNTSHFTDEIVTDDGPYATREAAEMGGKNAAYGWCGDNGVEVDDDESGEAQSIDELLENPR